MWSEKAIEAAWREFNIVDTSRSLLRPVDPMRAALEAAAAVDGDVTLDFTYLDSISRCLDDRYADTEAGTTLRALIKDAKLEILSLSKKLRNGDALRNAALEEAAEYVQASGSRTYASAIRALKRP